MSHTPTSSLTQRQPHPLCLACSSSLPPQKSASNIFTTRCCERPICPSCLTANPRLARYDPCLACLGGVGAVSSKQGESSKAVETLRNIDGAVRDEDTYIIGDDEEDEDEEEQGVDGPPAYSASPNPPASTTASEASEAPQATHTSSDGLQSEPMPAPTPLPPSSDSTPAPSKYYIKPGDNLQGLALRFGVDGRELCRMNTLPPSTLTTTPHILHTRTFLTLPPSAKSISDIANGTNADPEREARRARERAEKRLQTLTKEVDWRVARAYVALADGPSHGDAKEDVKPISGKGELEARAVDAYLDDEAWAASAEGREGRIQGFPYFTAGKGKGKENRWEGTAAGPGSWWRWKS